MRDARSVTGAAGYADSTDTMILLLVNLVLAVVVGFAFVTHLVVAVMWPHVKAPAELPAEYRVAYAQAMHDAAREEYARWAATQ